MDQATRVNNAERNRTAAAAHDKRIDKMARQKAGYSNRLANRVLKRLRSVYPQAIRMPEDISEHPSYHNTLVCLVELGFIDHVSVVRTIGGHTSIMTPSGRMALSYQGLVATQKDWHKVVTTVATVVTAVSATIGAIAVLVSTAL